MISSDSSSQRFRPWLSRIVTPSFRNACQTVEPEQSSCSPTAQRLTVGIQSDRRSTNSGESGPFTEGYLPVPMWPTQYCD